MSALEKLQTLLSQPKSRRIAIITALLGTVTPISGLHKFYLGQPIWGVIYLLLWSTPMPRIASAIDLVWYLVQSSDRFDAQFNGVESSQLSPTGMDPDRVGAIADALHQLDSLREEGLMTEYEFETMRRKLLG